MKNLTEIIVIIDKSGSMNSLKSKTIEGFNEFIHDQKKLKDDAILSLIFFSSPNREQIIYDSINIKNVPELTDKDYTPVGTTALYDCLGKTIKSVNKKIKNTKKEDRPNKVLFVIITDGFENSSKKYTKKDILDKISKMENKKDWSFIYLGANQDSFAEGSKIGINKTLNFEYSDNGVNFAYNKISAYTTSFRKSKNTKEIKL